MEYNFKGVYSTTESYAVKDVVAFTTNGVTSYYFCLQSNSSTNVQSPSSTGDTQYWGLISTLSNFPDSIDAFITRNTIQNTDKPRLQRFQELSLKSTLTSSEQNELTQLTQTLRDKLILPEDWNKLQDSITNMQMFFQTEIMVYWQSVRNEINQTKDSALQSIEDKRVSIINYLDTTEVGTLRNDIGDMTLLETGVRNNLVNVVNRLNSNHIDLSYSVDSIGHNLNETMNTLTRKANFYVPSGLISMWSGAISNIPSTWALCDGTNGTPDLRNRFIVGAGANYSVGNTGGSDSVTLNTNQIPSHSHDKGTLATLTDGGHYHSFSGTTSSAGEHTHNVGMGYSSGGDYSRYLQSGSSSQNSHDTANPVRNAGAHTHTFSGSTSSMGSHTHTITGQTANFGGGQSHENRPPYYALAYIMKL